jgi:hypothetical protein
MSHAVLVSQVVSAIAVVFVYGLATIVTLLAVFLPVLVWHR